MPVKTLTDFPDYAISPDGTVYSYKRKTSKPLSPRNINGYDTVVLTADGKQYVRYIHKLVAQELIYNDDPENKTQVIHKDGNKKNNDYSNLMWVKKGEGARRYFQTNEVRRNKFKESQSVPGEIFDETTPFQTNNDETKNQATDIQLTAKANHLTNNIEAIKRHYNKELTKLDQEYKKQIQQLKIHYKLNPKKTIKKIKELTQRNYKSKLRLNTYMKEEIKKLETQKTNVLRLRRQLNKYFFYNGEYHKITDTGKSLIIRVKDKDGKWTMLSVARIIMEDYLKNPQPTPNHRIGFKDFDYRNITPINMIWETPAEKSERFHKKFPFKNPIYENEKQNFNLSTQPEKFHDKIVRLLVEGYNYKQIARELEVSYYKLYRYCKKNDI
jgi:hypothetical protein